MEKLELLLNIREGDPFHVGDRPELWRLTRDPDSGEMALRDENGTCMPADLLIRILNAPDRITVEGEERPEYRSVFMQVNETLAGLLIRSVLWLMILVLSQFFLGWALLPTRSGNLPFLIMSTLAGIQLGWSARELVRFVKEHTEAFF